MIILCTAITFNSNSSYFGRNLDVEFSYGEKIIIVPKEFKISFRHLGETAAKYSIMGIGTLVDGYPLLYDAVNECGVGIAALRYADASYFKFDHDRNNVTSYELILYILGISSSCDEAITLLKNVNITQDNFSSNLPSSPLHWFICDKSKSIVVECTKEGLSVYDDSVGVLTNMPDFEKQIFNLNNYMHLSTHEPKKDFSDDISFKHYSRGMGALGLPGDYSSMSRFVRASFVKYNSRKIHTKSENAIGQFFHILDSVCQHDGCIVTEDGSYEKTLYTSCYDLEDFSLYYTFCNNRRITKISPGIKLIDSDEITVINMRNSEDIFDELKNGENNIFVSKH